MAKNILLESFVHHFLSAACRIAEERKKADPGCREWDEFILGLKFSATGEGKILVRWERPSRGEVSFDVDQAEFYRHGGPRHAGTPDPVRMSNERRFLASVEKVTSSAGLSLPLHVPCDDSPPACEGKKRHESEESFHDFWALAEDPRAIDVRAMNESCTAPEMRYIRKVLGNLQGKTVLDIGCGFGEASVYFALEGASVTAADLSQEMLNATQDLAGRYGVSVRPRKASAEDIGVQSGEKFDVVYAGNLFHHVDIEATVRNIVGCLKTDGILVSWDPVAYNPLINIYRAVATKVRTSDEHPLKARDIGVFERYFEDVETKWFWLTTLLIFIIMIFIQRRNPNKERFWKKVVAEGTRWRGIYAPLEKLDRILLKIFPVLRFFCWNVVITAKKPRVVAE